MTITDTDLDRIRGAALDRMDKARRWLWIFIALAALSEGGFLVTYLALMDFDDRLHVLVLVAACLIYITLGICVFALGAYIRMSTLRVIKGLELISGKSLDD